MVGTSGSGKSSLVRAGLIPNLHAEAAAGEGLGWRIAELFPGGAPMSHLAGAVARALAPERSKLFQALPRERKKGAPG